MDKTTQPQASSPMPGAELASKQEPLDEDFQRVLDDNLFDLYARDKPSPDDAELVRSGRIKAGMLRMGESIEFGSDADAIDALADRLAVRSAEVARLRENLKGEGIKKRTAGEYRDKFKAERDAAVEALRDIGRGGFHGASFIANQFLASLTDKGEDG